MVGFFQFLNFLYFHVDGVFAAARSTFVPICMIILSGFLLRYRITWSTSSSVLAPGRKRTFTFLFLDSLASLNPAIMESFTIKVVPFFHTPVDWSGGSFSDGFGDGFDVMVSWMLSLLLLLLVLLLLLFLLLFLLLMVVWLLSLLAKIVYFSVLLSLIWLFSVVKKTFFALFTSETCSVFGPLSIWKSMFLFDSKVCFLLIRHDDVIFQVLLVILDKSLHFACQLSMTSAEEISP